MTGREGARAKGFVEHRHFHQRVTSCVHVLSSWGDGSVQFNFICTNDKVTSGRAGLNHTLRNPVVPIKSEHQSTVTAAVNFL